MSEPFTPVLVGMLDSPFVRRVAITLHLHDMPFEHRRWSVFSNPQQVREFNPLGRVPSLQINADEVLIDSSAIIDYLDEQVATEQRLVPASGVERRRALKLISMTLGVCEKAVAIVYERKKRAAGKDDLAWQARLAEQLLLGGQWLDGQISQLNDRPDQMQLTAAVTRRFIAGYLPDQSGFLALPALTRLSTDCEQLKAFRAAPYGDD